VQAPGSTFTLYTQFTPGTSPSLSVMFNTGGYANALTACLSFRCTTSMPN
jgi:hypothetical protein